MLNILIQYNGHIRKASQLFDRKRNHSPEIRITTQKPTHKYDRSQNETYFSYNIYYRL